MIFWLIDWLEATVISLLPSPTEINKDGGAHEQATRGCQSRKNWILCVQWILVHCPKEKSMSDMLMDYFVITPCDEYLDIKSENSDDHAISSDESKSNPRARRRPVDDALLNRPTTSTGIALSMLGLGIQLTLCFLMVALHRVDLAIRIRIFIMNLRWPWQQDHVVGLFYNYEIDMKLFRGNIFCVRFISIMKISCNMVE